MNLSRLAFPLVLPLLHRLDAETAHRLSIGMLKLGPPRGMAPAGPLAVTCLGLRFPNPLGLAAGFDKDGEVPSAMLGLGFGFVEAGTVTPLPQAGNPRPRLFRLSEDKAVINRMGFNNDGAEAMRRRLEARRGKGGIVGVNIGANKDSSDRIGDYVTGVKSFADLASYLVVNISSPNTPGLRHLQARAELAMLLDAVIAARGASPTPLLVKIAPDLNDDELGDIAAACAGKADGIIVSNTTISRPALRSSHREQTGGLSGKPLFALSTRTLARLFLLTGGRLPLIGVGGITDAETAWIKIEAGASLIQIYSALVYRGPALIEDILLGLETRLAE